MIFVVFHLDLPREQTRRCRCSVVGARGTKRAQSFLFPKSFLTVRWTMVFGMPVNPFANLQPVHRCSSKTAVTRTMLYSTLYLVSLTSLFIFKLFPTGRKLTAPKKYDSYHGMQPIGQKHCLIFKMFLVNMNVNVLLFPNLTRNCIAFFYVQDLFHNQIITVVTSIHLY